MFHLGDEPGQALRARPDAPDAGGNLVDESVADEDAAVSSALRYIENLIDHLDYASARKRNLPIVSRHTEGAHCHILHPKLKVPEAWLPSKTHDIAQLIFARENQWDSFWENAALGDGLKHSRK